MFRRRVVQRVVEAIERRAHQQLGHRRGKAGAMAVLHSVGADLRPRSHVHVIATDGVFVSAPRGPASFAALLQPLEASELRELARGVGNEARRAVPSPDSTPQPGSGVRVVRDPPDFHPRGVVTEVRGAEVFVGDRIEAHDRQATESLTAYVLRPPLNPASVCPIGDDTVELRFRDAAPDGAMAVRLSKGTFEARVRAMANAGAVPRLTLHGALAPGSAVRLHGGGTQLSLVDAVSVRGKGKRQKHAERCRCGGRLEAVAAEPMVAASAPSDTAARR